MHRRNALFNPFAEVAEADPPDTDLVAEAQHGNRVALEKLVLRHQAWIGDSSSGFVALLVLHGNLAMSQALVDGLGTACPSMLLPESVARARTNAVPTHLIRAAA
jgi:hypothetical protein